MVDYRKGEINITPIDKQSWKGLYTIGNKFPIEIGNAQNFNKKATSESKITMIRLEDMFHFLTEELTSITVKEKEDSTAKEYICILRVRFWQQTIWEHMKRTFCWSIYSRNREKMDSIVLRRVVWDTKKDEEIVKKNVIWDLKKGKEIVKKNMEEHQKMDMAMLPSIDVRDQYIAYPQSDPIIQLVQDLDTQIGNGFMLYPNDAKRGEWNDLELLRLYDWGQVHMTWCPEKKNKCVEQSIKKLVSGLNPYIEQENPNIYSMSLNYNETPEKYRNWINERN